MNHNREIIDFLLPQFEPLQMTFFVMMLSMAIGTIIFNHKNAIATSWEKIWNNNTPDDDRDDLDIDHGSVTDLWRAVETKSEKLAEIMPGMLLVVGLLGTFLGLGMALNHASSILGQHDALSAAGQADSMKQLMEMMQGLGIKFKTSTWGITLFLLLKVWSSFTGFDEKRLAWVIRKVKVELEQRKLQLEKTEEIKQQSLFFQISQAAGEIVQGFTQNLAQLSGYQKAQHEKILQYMHETSQGIHQDLVSINTTMQSNNVAMKLVLEQSTQVVREDLAGINTAMRNGSSELKQTLVQISKVTHDDLANIQKVTQNDNAEMKLVLEQSTQGIRNDLAGINAASQVSSQAMSGFVDNTKSIIQDMSAASNKIADGAHQVGVAGSSLVKAVDDFSTQFTQVLGDVRTDLSTAINEMSTQAATTLKQGSDKLGEATREISAALDKLSGDVKTTMTVVEKSIKDSSDKQQKIELRFNSAVETLNTNVGATTGVVEKLGKDIESSLSNMATASTRVRIVGDSLNKIMNDLVPALEPLKTLPKQHQALITEMQGMRQDSQGQLHQLVAENKLLLSLQNDVNSTQHHSLISEIQGLRQDFKRETNQEAGNS